VVSRNSLVGANDIAMTQSASNPIASSRRILAGLLGAPIAQSAAPAMHERAAEALDLRCH
jgi:shikimate dehydrogenase